MVKPFEVPTIVARLELNPEWRLKTKFRLTLKPPSKEDQAKWIQDETTIKKAEISSMEMMFKSLEVSLMKTEDLQAEL